MAFPGLRILVVEDEQAMRCLLNDLLSFRGCIVELAVNGEEGIEKYRQFRPDLVLMDLEMPVMNGFDASREIVEFDPQASIFLITAFADTILARRALREGLVRIVISKPFGFEQLAMAIQWAVKNRTPLTLRRSQTREVLNS